MAKQIVTLYVDDTSLRLMVTDGKQIKEWAELPLEPGLIKGNVVIKEAEVAARLKQLFKLQKVQTKKVSLGLSGLHCLTRPILLPHLPDEMLTEAVKREAKRVLPVPPEQLYLSWQTIPAPEGKTQVFLVAIPCQMADALLKTLRQAGLEASFMEVKPLLLAGTVKAVTGVIVDVQQTDFDIVIMIDGVPQPVRSIPFLDEALPWQEKSMMIGNELDRTIQFYNSNNPEKPLAASLPIFTSGELADKSELCQALSERLGHPVSSLPSLLESPEGFDTSRYMVNIGLALQKLSLRGETGSAVAVLNALPIPYRPKPISLTNILAPSGVAIAAGLLALLAILNQDASADIAAIRVKLNTTSPLLQQRVAQRQELMGNIAKLQNEITQLEASRASFTTAADSLEKQKAGIIAAIEITVESLSSEISLSSIDYADSVLTISGQAPNGRVVISYFGKLDRSGRFSEVGIKNMTTIEGRGVDFTLIGNFEKQSVANSTRALLNSLPSTIILTGIGTTDGSLTIDGRGTNEKEILSYLQKLETSGTFSEINLTSVTRIENGGVDFSLFLKTGE